MSSSTAILEPTISDPSLSISDPSISDPSLSARAIVSGALSSPSPKRDVRAFWDERAGLGEWAGTRDVIAKQLEMEAICRHIRDGMRVLEVGCGNGITAIEVARRFHVTLTGSDFAPQMVAAANALLSGQELKGQVTFEVQDVRDLTALQERFDLIYTERVLINLPDWNAQAQAIRQITDLLTPGGLYVMCENTQNGLDRLNALRNRVELETIVSPWHNRYLREAEVAGLTLPGVTLEDTEDYSSTYYFLSRVVNAARAAQDNREPSYEDPINQLALRLPSSGDVGQGRLWLWRKSL